jgi:NitT/TauT family transport system substrate-binding protein
LKLRIIIAFLSAVGLFALTGCDSSKPKISSGQPEQTLVVGIYHGDISGQIWIAEKQGYFAKQGLKVDIRSYTSGMEAMQDMLAGKVDISTTSDFVAAGAVLRQSPVRIISSLCQPDMIRLVGRKDHGITQLSDLRNKSVGVLDGTAGEFFLDLMLVMQNIPSDEVRKVDLGPLDQVKAIAKGEIDAVVLWEPFVASICNELGANAFNESAQSGQTYYFVLLGMEDTLKKRPRAVQSFVSSLIAAEEFLKNHPSEAKMIVGEKLGLKDLSSLWSKTSFEVCLDYPLILTMEAQMRWINQGSAADQSEMPNLLKFIYFDALKGVQPERIKMPGR